MLLNPGSMVRSCGVAFRNQQGDIWVLEDKPDQTLRWEERAMGVGVPGRMWLQESDG